MIMDAVYVLHLMIWGKEEGLGLWFSLRGELGERAGMGGVWVQKQRGALG